jgi:drug/metabolite transporter (DMT)-like permease
MIWVIFAALTTLFESLKDVGSKQSLKYFSTYHVAWATQVFTVLFSLPTLIWTGWPSLGPNFLLAILAGGSLNVVAFLLYVQALQEADLSLTVPLVALTPVFLLVTSPLIVHEYPGWGDGIGVVLIVLGSYVLNLTPEQRDWRSPLITMVKNPGCRKMLLVAFLWSFTSNFDKMGVVNSSPQFWTISLAAFLVVGMGPILIWQRKKEKPHRQSTPRSWQLLVITGLFSALAIGFQMVAIGMTTVAQVIAIKRMSALLSVGFGHWLFGEVGLRERLSGALIMVLGVAIITFF